MSGLGFLFPLLIAAVIFVAVFLFVAVFSSQIEKKIDPFLAKYLRELEQEFSILEIPLTPKRFLLFQVALCTIFLVFGLVIGTDLVTKIIFAIFFACLALFATKRYIVMMKGRRRAKFEEQFVDAIAIISNAVRSGLSLMQAIELTVKEMPDPVSYEINLVIQATRVGVPLDVALTEWSNRMNSNDLDIFVTAVIIQSQTGGNITEILETLGSTIRERFKIQRQIKTLTSQGVLSSYILTGLPIILGVVLFFIQPKNMSLLFTTSYGLLMLAVSLTMIGVGGYIVKKIVTIDI